VARREPTKIERAGPWLGESLNPGPGRKASLLPALGSQHTFGMSWERTKFVLSGNRLSPQGPRAVGHFHAADRRRPGTAVIGACRCP